MDGIFLVTERRTKINLDEKDVSASLLIGFASRELLNTANRSVTQAKFFLPCTNRKRQAVTN